MMQSSQGIKVLYLSPIPPPMGGMAKWTETLFKHGLPVLFKIDLVDTSLPPKRKIFSPTKINKSEIKRTAVIFFRLTKAFILFRPDIIHLCCSLSPHGIVRDYICAAVSKILGAKVVTHYRGNVADFSQTAWGGLSYKILIRLIRMSHVNILENLPSFRFIDGILADRQHKNHYLLPNFVDDAVFDEKEKWEDKNKKHLRAIYIGGITHQKGAHDIVKIAPEFKDIEFVLVGPVLEDFCPLIDNLPVNVRVLPSMNTREVFKELRKSDFFIFLSHSEGFPGAILEAMAAGLPIVATNVGAIPEIVDNEKGGYICPPKNIEKIKEAIVKLKNHHNLELLGRYNFEKAKLNYSYSVVINQLCQIYKGLMSGSLQ